jgi:hypothetical protein
MRKETLLVDNIARLWWWGSNNDKWRYSSWWERWSSARLWLSMNGMHVLLWESSWFIINNWYIQTHSLMPKWTSNKTTLHICMQNKYLVMLNFRHDTTSYVWAATRCTLLKHPASSKHTGRVRPRPTMMHLKKSDCFIVGRRQFMIHHIAHSGTWYFLRYGWSADDAISGATNRYIVPIGLVFLAKTLTLKYTISIQDSPSCVYR